MTTRPHTYSLLLMVIVITLVALPAVSMAQGRTLQDDDFGVSVTAPPAFQLNQRNVITGDDLLHARFISAKDENDNRRIIRLHSIPARYSSAQAILLSLEQNMATVEYNLTQQFALLGFRDAIVHFQSSKLVEHKDALELIFEIETLEYEFAVYTYMMYGRGRLFMLEFYDYADGFEEELPAFRTSADSLVIPGGTMNFDITRMNNLQKVLLLMVVLATIFGLRVLMGGQKGEQLPAAVRIAQERVPLHDDLLQRGKDVSYGESDYSHSGGYKASAPPPKSIPPFDDESLPSPDDNPSPPPTDSPDTLFPDA